jgi:uncharacterized damage-inducible protein DinB
VSCSKRRAPLKGLLTAAFAAGMLVNAAGVRAQTRVPTILQMRDGYLADMDTVHAKIMALANAIPETKFDWKPTPEVRTVSNALMHIALEWTVWVPVSAGGMPPAGWSPETRAKLMAVTGKKQVLEELDKAWRHGRQQLASATEEKLANVRFTVYDPPLPFDKAAFKMAGDLHEHLGQLITYSRLLGVVPPWSK